MNDDLERSGRGVIEVLFWKISGGAEEDHENLQSGMSFVPRFELRASLIRA
jgi:hypothetical protein